VNILQHQIFLPVEVKKKTEVSVTATIENELDDKQMYSYVYNIAVEILERRLFDPMIIQNY
jgi:hypothetical protein